MGKVRQQYLEFIKLYLKAHPNVPKDKCQDDAVERWKELKVSNKEVDEKKYKEEMTRLQGKLITKKKTMFEFMIKSKKKTSPDSGSPSQSQDSPEIIDLEASSAEASSEPSGSNEAIEEDGANGECNSGDNRNDSDEDLNISDTDNIEPNSVTNRVYESPAQQKLKADLSDINARISSLNDARNLGIGEENVASLTKQIKDWNKKKETVMASLKRLKTSQKSSKKHRDKKKRVIAKVIEDYPSIQGQLSVRESVGRPSMEEICPNLHHDILQIATIGAAASEKRREDLFRSVKTLDDLHRELSNMGYRMARSTLYTRLLPKTANSSEGKKHVSTVPVRYIYNYSIC